MRHPSRRHAPASPRTRSRRPEGRQWHGREAPPSGLTPFDLADLPSEVLLDALRIQLLRSRLDQGSAGCTVPPRYALCREGRMARIVWDGTSRLVRYRAILGVVEYLLARPRVRYHVLAFDGPLVEREAWRLTGRRGEIPSPAVGQLDLRGANTARAGQAEEGLSPGASSDHRGLFSCCGAFRADRS